VTRHLAVIFQAVPLPGPLAATLWGGADAMTTPPLRSTEIVLFQTSAESCVLHLLGDAKDLFQAIQLLVARIRNLQFREVVVNCLLLQA
jgi:hypothetical protein